MAHVVEVSRAELLRRREELLKEVPGGFKALAERAERGDLRGNEWVLWEQLRSIDFLLGDDDAAEQ